MVRIDEMAGHKADFTGMVSKGFTTGISKADF